MSLEAAIKALTEAVEANTAALKGGGGGTTKSTGTKSTGTKSTSTSKKTTTKKGPSVDDVLKEFGEFMKTGDKGEREEAKANVAKIVAHFDVDRISNLDEDNFQEALDLLAQIKDGEDPFGDGDEDDGDDLM